jgi:ribosomal protein S18 acetylase RimI-like enzyme
VTEDRAFAGAIAIRPSSEKDDAWLERLLDEHWGGPFQVANGERYRPADLPGFVAELAGGRVGYAAVRIVDGVAWIGVIHSLREGIGVGSALVRAIVAAARDDGCSVLRAITTNDNVRAQGFYSRLGFRLREVRPGEVTKSRMMKPSIPLTSEDGVVITDELEYELDI